MPIITGTIQDETESLFVGTVYFENLDAPCSSGSRVTGSATAAIQTLSDGTIPANTHIAAGRTCVTINGRKSKPFIVPDGTLSYPLKDLMAATQVVGSIFPSDRILEWAIGENYILTNIAYDSDGAESSADVIWPDNPGVVGGVFAVISKNATIPNLIDSFTLTHTASGNTVTQPAVTRDVNGRITISPAPIIS
jgi:hypothetical protein